MQESGKPDGRSGPDDVDGVLAATVRRQGAEGVIVLSGEFDLSGCELLARKVAELVDEQEGERVTRVRVDVAGLTFIDSAGLAGLLNARKTLRMFDIGFSLEPTSPKVRRLVDLAGVADELLTDGDA